jgi:hypothetical protein
MSTLLDSSSAPGRWTTPLSPEQVEQFRRDGYLLIPGFLDATTNAELILGADQLVEHVINSTIALGRRNPRADMLYDDSGALLVRRISPVADIIPAARALAGLPRLHAAVAQLGCMNPVLIESKLNYKQRFPRAPTIPYLRTKSAGDSWPLHHDWGYYRQQGYPPVAVTVALSLDDCVERGPMVVVPGSHRTGSRLLVGDPDSGTGRVAERSVGDVRTVIHASAGSALLFHCMLVHSSPPNPSPLPRRILHLTYAPEFADGTAAYRRNGRWQEYAARFEARYRDLLAAGEARENFRIAEE